MTCHDCMEWIQRNLDHDLNETEELELKLHMNQCPECTELFARLQRLDEELSQLPKVTPAYSLVDAIMPQLTELDRLPASLEETAALEPNVSAPFGGIPRTRRSFFSWKIAAVTAVAVTVIGLLVLKEQNPSVTPSVRGQKAASSAGAAVSVPDKQSPESTPIDTNKKDEATADASTFMKEINPQGVSESQQQKPHVSSPPAAATQHEVTRKKQSSSTAPEPRKESRNPADTERSHSVEISSPQEPSNNELSNNQTAQPNVPSSDTTNSAASPAQPANTPKGITAAPDAGTSGEPAPVKQTAPIALPKQVFNALIAPQAAEMKSADGKLVAAVQEQRVVVRNAVNGENLYTSIHVWSQSDQITLVGWSPDNKLTYRVQHTDISDTFLLDPAARTETPINDPEAANPDTVQKTK